jgi:hypothetical protein
MRVASTNFWAIVLLCLGVTACAPSKQYRTHYDTCISAAPTPSPDCETHALQEFPVGDGANYLLGFIEIDDQGQLWHRPQMQAVLGKLYEQTAGKDLLMVVFVHGWKHSAAPGDGNITTFRNVLAKLAEAEAYHSHDPKVPARQVVGIYIGWRGGSVTVPIIENLTFWDRKNTAQKVGYGGVTEVLSRLELVKADKDIMAGGGSNTRLVVVGHSFGGAVVNSALVQILESRFVRTVGPAGVQGDVAGFGNLVVLINPAFEALLFAPLSNMTTERGAYFDSQLPVLVELTSEADDATGIAFPIGRWFSTFFEESHPLTRHNATTKSDETIDEGKANVTALGHFPPYRTHWLYPADERTREEIPELSPAASVNSFIRSSAKWANDTPGSKIPFEGLILERTPESAGRNPYLLVRVDKRLIRDHNDIADSRVIEFVTQIILLSSQTPEQAQHIRGSTAPEGSP